VRQAVDYWLGLRGARRFPTRGEIHPRDIKAILPNLLLIRVLDAGADFEFRIAGDVQRQTFTLDFSGRRMSELIGSSPVYGHALRGLYRYVTESGEPVALRGNFGPGFEHVTINYCESASFPLGQDDVVDHLLCVTAFVGKTG